MESLLLPIVDFDSLGRPIKEEDFSCLSMSSPTEDIPHSSPMGLEADLPSLDAESTSSPAPSTPNGSLLDDDCAPSSNSSTPPKRKRGSGGTKRKQVKRACSNCRKAHAGCDENRPCRRCVGGGKENSCKDVPRKKRSRSRTDTKDKTSYKKDKKNHANSILETLDADDLNHNINSAIDRKRKRRGCDNHTETDNSCSSDCHSSQGESDHNCESEYVEKQPKKRRNISQSASALKREKSFANSIHALSSSTSSIFSTHKIKSEHLDDLDLSPNYTLSAIKSEQDLENENTEEENIFDSDIIPSSNSTSAASKQLVFSTFTNYGNILNPNTSSQSNSTTSATNSNSWNINYGWDDGTSMENKLQDLLGEVKYSLNYQQHSLSIHSGENGYGVGIELEEEGKLGGIMGGEEIGKTLDLNTFFGGEGEFLGGAGSDENFIYGWEEILNGNNS
eukprot:TRINITY_DN331_c0_g1_i1.p1 TRINITY_DN331_c0_g1~~TRINITY_DN331_c0_g1_i1.p1  ORF type:complete len:449 (-),score=107.38 TRINITY_DN331_c0_g1_i1:244-1590(-)